MNADADTLEVTTYICKGCRYLEPDGSYCTHPTTAWQKRKPADRTIPRDLTTPEWCVFLKGA
jgi:hypothetical protein